jgi:hypothetical protein
MLLGGVNGYIVLYRMITRKNFLFSSSTAERNHNPSLLILEWALLWVLLGFTTMITGENPMKNWISLRIVWDLPDLGFPQLCIVVVEMTRKTEDFYLNRKREMTRFQCDKQILNSGLNKKRG